MKNKFKTLLAVGFLSIATVSYAQVRIVNSATNAGVGNMTAFIDASSNSTANSQPNVGKGLLFPRTDLTTLTAFGGGATGAPTSFPTRYDGMIVYNTATSGVAGVGSTQGTLSPGYWYYENKSTTVNGGIWKPLASTADPKFNVTNDAAGTATNTLVNGNQVYAIKGQFTASGTSTAVNIPAPAGITAMYGITIYKAGTNTVYDRSLYSYDTTSGNAITGSPNMSVVYPNGTYEYVLEYLK